MRISTLVLVIFAFVINLYSINDTHPNTIDVSMKPPPDELDDVRECSVAGPRTPALPAFSMNVNCIIFRQ